MKRRTFLAAGATGIGVLTAPSILRAQTGPVRVGVYGGYFQDSFDEHIFPDFTAETGIEVQSVGTPTGEAWLV
jgi:putative spermidine/putrescine transport system substrate-binding protein